MIRKEISLLDVLASEAHCQHLSDLKFLTDGQREHLAKELTHAPASLGSLQDWNEALEYVAKYPPEATPEAARERLIQALSQSRTTGRDA